MVAGRPGEHLLGTGRRHQLRLERRRLRPVTELARDARTPLVHRAGGAQRQAVAGPGPARRALSEEQLHAPHLIDSEVANALRRHVATRRLEAPAAWTALDHWRRVAMTRYPVVGVLERTWELRESVSAYDAAYIALAELLDCSLFTVDARLSRAPGSRCPVTVVPR